MAGIKGKSGGGGRGAGRLRSRITLNKDSARMVKTLVSNLRSAGSQIDENQFVNQLIAEKWQEYNQGIESAIEEMGEFIL